MSKQASEREQLKIKGVQLALKNERSLGPSLGS